LTFLGAGGLLLGHAIVIGLQAFTNVTVTADVFAPVGHLLALVGLVGLYPVANDRTPTLARIGAVVAAVLATGWAVVTLSILATTFGNQPPQIETLLGVVSIVVLVSTVLPYVLFGVVTFRSDVAPRRVCLLVLVPAAMLVVLLADIAILGAPPAHGVVIGTGLAVSMLSLGHTLRIGEINPDRASPDSDVTPG
jgi:uncharacterized membrane protein